MTNDDHVRIYADGECEGLPAFADFRACSEDPEKDARLIEEFEAEQQQIADILRDKGF